MTGSDLRAQGDIERAERLLAEHEIRKAIEEFERRSEESSARRHLLATALRLTPAMAPDVHELVDGCSRRLGLDLPVEAYVYPEASFNAAAVRPERGRLFVMFSSSLLEAFEPDELRFVVGHELAHHLYEHHKIPTGALLGRPGAVSPGLALRLFAWQRYGEISADRAGVFCAGGLKPAAHALFKLASGLRGGRVNVRVEEFLSQIEDLRAETDRAAKASERPRSDWLSTHPFSPLRLMAARMFVDSELMKKGGTARDAFEAQVHDLLGIMEPNYFQEKSSVAEAMRRLLFAGGVAVASASGEISEKEIEALESLLGAGSLPFEIKPDVIAKDLDRRIADVKKSVPPLRRAQVIRDLILIARADGTISKAEQDEIDRLAEAIDVDPAALSTALEEPEGCC